jgi:hypothetical protein
MLKSLELAAGVLDSEVINNQIEEMITCEDTGSMLCGYRTGEAVWYGRGEVAS